MNKKESGKENNDIKFKKLNNFWKIRRGSNYNAFHRKNLGSIPSKFDNFIFKLPDESKTNLTSTLKPMMLKHENLCFFAAEGRRPPWGEAGKVTGVPGAGSV